MPWASFLEKYVDRLQKIDIVCVFTVMQMVLCGGWKLF
jgi:hypothetical protein